jgi:hypothetical protein
MKKAGIGAAAIVVLCLSLGLALAAPAPVEDPELEKLKAAKENPTTSIAWKQMELENALDVLGRVGGFHVTFGEGFPKGKKVTYDIAKIGLKDFLRQIAYEQGLAYEVPKEDTLVIKGAATKS